MVWKLEKSHSSIVYFVKWIPKIEIMMSLAAIQLQFEFDSVAKFFELPLNHLDFLLYAWLVVVRVVCRYLNIVQEVELQVWNHWNDVTRADCLVQLNSHGITNYIIFKKVWKVSYDAMIAKLHG
jgi:hypothetical protein